MRRQLDSGGWKHLQHLVETTGLQFLELCVWVQQQQCNGRTSTNAPKATSISSRSDRSRCFGTGIPRPPVNNIDPSRNRCILYSCFGTHGGSTQPCHVCDPCPIVSDRDISATLSPKPHPTASYRIIQMIIPITCMYHWSSPIIELISSVTSDQSIIRIRISRTQVAASSCHSTHRAYGPYALCVQTRMT
eukprot:COSAG02_NODE_243_length_27457_cov_16.852328_17_plen_190_part_00